MNERSSGACRNNRPKHLSYCLVLRNYLKCARQAREITTLGESSSAELGNGERRISQSTDKWD